MKTISLTVPMDYNALTRASDMLHGLAIDLKHEGGESSPKPTSATPAQTVTGMSDGPAEPEAEVTSAPNAGTSTAAVDDQPEPVATEVFGDTPSPSLPAELPPGVDLAPSVNTGALIPWDHRIHASSKAKLAKSPHGWKMKRGVPDDLVDQVEAELVSAMKASPANPVGNAAPVAVDPSATPAAPVSPAAATTTAADAVSPANPVTPNVQPAPAAASATTTPSTPAAPAQPAAEAVTTFPALMAKITASGIDQATVTAAVNKQGLPALPLLAARPDLIPAVAAELFPGG